MEAIVLRRMFACALTSTCLLAVGAAPAAGQRPANAPLPPAPSAVRVADGEARAVAALLDSVRAVAGRGDSATFRRLAAPEFIFIHSSGQVDDVPTFLAFAARARFDTARMLSPTEYRAYGAARDVVLVLTHTANLMPGRGWDAYRATDLVVRDPGALLGWRWLAHQSTRLPNAGSYIALPAAVLDAYVGQYGTAGDPGGRTVTRDGERLLLSSNTGGRPLPFRPLTESTFGLENGQMYLVFARDATGRVQHLDVLQREQASRLTRLPTR